MFEFIPFICMVTLYVTNEYETKPIIRHNKLELFDIVGRPLVTQEEIEMTINKVIQSRQMCNNTRTLCRISVSCYHVSNKTESHIPYK